MEKDHVIKIIPLFGYHSASDVKNVISIRASDEISRAKVKLGIFHFMMTTDGSVCDVNKNEFSNSPKKKLTLLNSHYKQVNVITLTKYIEL